LNDIWSSIVEPLCCAGIPDLSSDVSCRRLVSWLRLHRGDHGASGTVRRASSPAAIHEPIGWKATAAPAKGRHTFSLMETSITEVQRTYSEMTPLC